MISSIINKEQYTNKEIFIKEYQKAKDQNKLNSFAKKLGIKKGLAIQYNAYLTGKKSLFTPTLNFWNKFAKSVKKGKFEKNKNISVSNISFQKIENILKKNKKQKYFLIVLEFLCYSEVEQFRKFISEGINRHEIEIIGIKQIVSNLISKFKARSLISKLKIKLIGVYLKFDSGCSYA